MARPNKYDTNIKPFLKQIADWKRNGATDEQVCKQLHVSCSVFYAAKAKHKEFSDVLKISRDGFVADLRGELARLAFKHELTTTKEYTATDAEGIAKTCVEKTTKEIDGNIAAIHLLLKNLDRKNWADNPQNVELKKQELELKKLIAEANNFDLNLGENNDV